MISKKELRILMKDPIKDMDFYLQQIEEKLLENAKNGKYEIEFETIDSDIVKLLRENGYKVEFMLTEDKGFKKSIHISWKD